MPHCRRRRFASKALEQTMLDHVRKTLNRVWFIHGGFLYEVTAYKELDTWLKPILQSWQFIQWGGPDLAGVWGAEGEIGACSLRGKSDPNLPHAKQKKN
jgi:hypothetical protein